MSSSGAGGHHHVGPPFVGVPVDAVVVLRVRGLLDGLLGLLDGLLELFVQGFVGAAGAQEQRAGGQRQDGCGFMAVNLLFLLDGGGWKKVRPGKFFAGLARAAGGNCLLPNLSRPGIILQKNILERRGNAVPMDMKGVIAQAAMTLLLESM